MPLLTNQPDGACDRAGMSPAKVEEIVRVFSAMVEDGTNRGAQLAVWRNGELAIELAAGADGRGEPLRLDSLQCIFSTTKALTAMAAHTLHDRGKFGYDDRVAAHWPGFAANGKEEITIRQVMSHRAGLTNRRQWGSFADWASPGGERRLVEAMSPAFEPGTQNAYHAVSYGQVMGELIRIWSGTDVGRFLRREICEPLGISDVYIGIGEEELARFAPSVPRRGGDPAQFPFNRLEVLRLPMAWVCGVARARDLAELFNVYAFEGSYGGKTFFSKETFNEITTPTNSSDDVDGGVQAHTRWGLGLSVAGTEGTAQTTGRLYGTNASPRTCGHLGANTSLAWADPDLRLAVSFISTSAEDGISYQPLSDAIRAACVL